MTAPNSLTALYPEVEPYETGTLSVDDIHTLYWEQTGNPTGVPVVFIHGGPGAGSSAQDRRFFDPEHYRIILYDQRGCGRSRPLAELTNNTTDLLVEDLESLRKHLKIAQWHVFGGSWGSTLGLYYSQCHPHRCLSLTLRGIFLMRAKEISWWLYDMRQFFPERWKTFAEHIPLTEQSDLLEAYWKRLISDDPEVRLAAAQVWSEYEGACCTLRPNPDFLAHFQLNKVALSLARLEAHYFRTQRFEPEDRLLQDIHRVSAIPSVIVQGRYDVVCPIVSADELHQRWPQADYQIIEDAGHSSREPGICAALVDAMDRFRSLPSLRDA